MAMTNLETYHPDYECIDPELGAELWRLEDPDTDDELRSRLGRHLRHCAACRQRNALSRVVAEGLRDGRLTLRPVAAGASWAIWSQGLGAGALAACLALMLALPPRLPATALTMRGGDGPVVTAPLPGSVILDRTPVLRWTAVAPATRYHVTIREVGGDYQWQGETTAPEIAVPAGARLPRPARLRASVEPVPAYVVPDGALQFSFRTGTLGEFALFRLTAASRPVLIGVFLGTLGLMIGTIGRARVRA